MTLRSLRTGSTILEMMTVLAVFTVGAAGMYAALDGGVSFAASAENDVVTDSESRHATAALTDLLVESSPALVDTAMRIHIAWSPASDVMSDRFELPGNTIAHCPSPICRFHTRQDLSTITPNYHCGREQRSGAGTLPTVRGKHFPAGTGRCPFDGTTLVAGAHLDGIKLLTSRQKTGGFETSGADPAWNNLVFVFPYADADGTCELRRYEVGISDLLAGSANVSAGWSRFDPAAPSFVDLLDVGEDGTTNGLPDGSVPLSTSASDAEIEAFLVSTINGQPSIVLLKRLGNPTTFPYRRVLITVRLSNGYTRFDVIHQDSSTEWWSTEGTFVRAPKTLARNVTEFAVSTSASNPHDLATNPTGVENDRHVRVTIGASRAEADKGARTWTHDVATFVVAPRN